MAPLWSSSRSEYFSLDKLHHSIDLPGQVILIRKLAIFAEGIIKMAFGIFYFHGSN